MAAALDAHSRCAAGTWARCVRVASSARRGGRTAKAGFFHRPNHQRQSAPHPYAALALTTSTMRTQHRAWSALLVAALLTLLSLLAGQADAHMIELAPNSNECFFEDLNPGDQMTLTYQVGGGGNLDVDAILTDPNHEKLFELLRKDTGTYSLTAQHAGRYTYCFSNLFSTVSDKTVSFNVHGIIYVPDDGEMLPIEREIRDLAAGLQAVKDEQEYLVIRERVHRNTAESTFSRVKWWSVIQAFLVIGACSFQVYFVKRQFEVRRVI